MADLDGQGAQFALKPADFAFNRPFGGWANITDEYRPEANTDFLGVTSSPLDWTIGRSDTIKYSLAITMGLMENEGADLAKHYLANNRTVNAYGFGQRAHFEFNYLVNNLRSDYQRDVQRAWYLEFSNEFGGVDKVGVLRPDGNIDAYNNAIAFLTKKYETDLTHLYLNGNGILQYGASVLGTMPDLLNDQGAKCFPADTRIQTSRTTSTAISAVRVGDVVLAFDASADKGRGALVPRRVTRLYRNTTTDWIRLRWFDGTAREVITTISHHFLCRLGGFRAIEYMPRNEHATISAAVGVPKGSSILGFDLRWQK